MTAAAILLLAERHKVSLDDKVARFLPDLTGADKVTIRNLLTHTSGYQDYYAEDYLLLMAFLHQEIFDKLGMKSPVDIGGGWSADDATAIRPMA